MVVAWYMNDISDDGDDQRQPHQTDLNQFVSLKQLEGIGVMYWKIDVDSIEDSKLPTIRKEQGYGYDDLIEIHPDRLVDYHNKIKSFFKEHLHEDDEIRLIFDGSGYFDVRDKDDKWVRIAVSKDDLLVLPAGIYHRFTTDNKDYIKAMRLFKGVPVWTPINRPADDLPIRKAYLKLLEKVVK